MAEYRQIHTKIWKDEWFLDLAPDEKLLFVYLFSNDSTSVAGIYRIAPKVIEFETGLSKKAIAGALAKFEKVGKVLCRDGVTWIVNLRHYNSSKSPKVRQRIAKDLGEIPDCELRRLYCEFYNEEYPIDTVCIPYPESESDHEQEQEQEQEHIPTVAKKPAPKPKKPKEPKPDDPQTQMMTVFLKVTRLEMPTLKSDVGFWWSTMGELLNIANKDPTVGIQLIEEAVSQMKQDQLTIASPKSLVNIVRALAAKRRRCTPDEIPDGRVEVMPL